MDATNLRHMTSAHQDALAQLDLATVAVQAAGLGRVSPAIQKDIADLLTVQDRVSRRLTALAGLMAQVDLD